MSIIGTRPPLISETNFYELHHRARLAIKPGITGMWQVSGRSDITDFEEVVRLDKEYITNWNINDGYVELFFLAYGGAGMTGKKKLPIGIDIFEKLDREEFYYVDKTGMIEDLLQNRSEVNLFTRPRHFGKSLNMSMLKAFFEIGGDPALFKGLKISERKDLCEKYMGQFPVIFISLKSVEGLSFTVAGDALKTVIGTEAFCEAFLDQNPKKIEEIFSDYLWNNCKVMLG